MNTKRLAGCAVGRGRRMADVRQFAGRWKELLTWTAIVLIVVGLLAAAPAAQYLGLAAAGVALVLKIVGR